MRGVRGGARRVVVSGRGRRCGCGRGRVGGRGCGRVVHTDHGQGRQCAVTASPSVKSEKYTKYLDIDCHKYVNYN